MISKGPNGVATKLHRAEGRAAAAAGTGSVTSYVPATEPIVIRSS